MAPHTGLCFQYSDKHAMHTGSNEAGAYLTFIAEYYDCLPEVCSQFNSCMHVVLAWLLLLQQACPYSKHKQSAMHAMQSTHVLLCTQVTLFAHSHRKSSWHSVYSLASNVHHARWDRVPGFAFMHQKGIWFDFFVSNTTRNIEGAVHNNSDTRCDEVRDYSFISCLFRVCLCPGACLCQGCSVTDCVSY